MNVVELKNHIIAPTLKQVGLYSEDAEALLLGIAEIESQSGVFLKQIGGPALGIYMMEPATHDEVWRYLEKKPELYQRIEQVIGANGFGQMKKANRLVYDLNYATVLTRCFFLRFKTPIPDKLDVTAMANYWKHFYNTGLGKGDVFTFIKRYHQKILPYLRKTTNPCRT